MSSTTSKKGTLITVMNPRGTAPDINLVPMAPRLKSLDGKTIYIVNPNFPLTENFYTALMKLLKKKYAGTNWVLKKKSGTTFTDAPELWKEIKEKADGAIVGPGHMDTLGPAVVNWCITLEKLGVPAAPIICQAYPEIVRNVAYEKGMPKMRLTFIPYMVSRSEETCREYLLGKDPVTGKVLLDELMAALTAPLKAEEKKTGVINRNQPKMMKPDTEENLQQLFMENGWTDGLPIVLPTVERVKAMLKGTSHKPDEIVGKMSPASVYEPWTYNVEQVAVNAVMTGAKPEYFPVMLAVAATGVTALWSSLTSHARMMVINGPIRNEIKMNYDIGALGPFNQANATVGRAWTFFSKNLAGGGIPGVNYLGTIGNSYNYNNLCCAENEEALPKGWQPLHIQRGFKAKDSTVSLFHGWSLSSFTAIKPDPRHEIMKRQLAMLETTGTGAHFFPGVVYGSEATILASPVVANTLVKEGFDTKEKLSKWLKDNTRMTMWNYWLAKPDDMKAAKRGEEPYASLLKLPLDAPSPEPLIKKDSPVTIALVGGETDQIWQLGDFGITTTVSIDKWR